MHPPKILIVDDDLNILEVLAAIISDNNFKVLTCTDAEEALGLLEHDPDINAVITDLNMGNMSGEAFFNQINEHYPYVPVIVLTAYGTIESAVDLVKKGAFDYLEKPSDHRQLIRVLEAAVRHNTLQQEIQFLRQEMDHHKGFCNIVGKSRKMLEVFDLIKAVANSDFNVLIGGESGTGKELVAKAIYQKSSRCKGPYVAINCSAIPHNLMESELFGYEPGAFTGAVNKKEGKFELADQGVLFLDEIGELDKPLQSKLLRILEEKSFQRLGGNKDIKTDFRLIAATNRDLKKEVRRTNFREDLFYRLNVLKVQLPPLRDRGEDISILAQFFVKKYSALENKEAKEISPKALQLINNYHWPGNIRELENVIKRTIILSKGPEIKKNDLPSEITRSSSPESISKKKKRARQEDERRRILEALKKAGGNKSKAASLLAMHRRQLYRKLEEYNIDCDNLDL